MYYWRFRKWPDFQKNAVQAQSVTSKGIRQKPEVLRTRRKEKLREISDFEDLLFQRLAGNIPASTSSSSLPIKSTETYRLQEVVLHSVHNFVFGLFETHRWTADQLSILPPSGSLDLSRMWQQLADQVFGARVLIHKLEMRQAGQTIRNIFHLLERVAFSPDPVFHGYLREHEQLQSLKFLFPTLSITFTDKISRKLSSCPATRSASRS